MNKKIKRLLTVALSAIMILQVLSPATAMAATRESEPNDYRAKATVLKVGTKCKGEIGSYAVYTEKGDLDEDWYKIKLKGNHKYKFHFSNFCRDFAKTTLLINLHKSNGQETNDISFSYQMEETGSNYVNFKTTKAGYYYIRVYNYFDYETDDDHPYKIWVTDREKKKSKGITLNRTSLKLKKGKTFKLKATTNPKGKKVKWTTSNKKVATVSKSGKVTAKKAGKAKITAKFTYNGKTYKKVCKVTVVKK